MGELLAPLGKAAGTIVAWTGTALGLNWALGASHDANNTGQSKEPYPGYSQGAPPPLVDPLGKGIIGGLLGSAQFSESFFVILLIVVFIVGVRYLKH